jgi:ATP-dependent RNA helicase DBP3
MGKGKRQLDEDVVAVAAAADADEDVDEEALREAKKQRKKERRERRAREAEEQAAVVDPVDGDADDAAEEAEGSDAEAAKKERKRQRKEAKRAAAAAVAAAAAASATPTGKSRPVAQDFSARAGAGAPASGGDDGDDDGDTAPPSTGLRTQLDDGLEVLVEGVAALTPHDDFTKVAPSVASLCKGFVKPTAIQRFCWPALALDRDVVGIAETGSGKTLAFSLPIMAAILKAKPSTKGTHVRMLVVAPTRELACQTYDVVKSAIPSICIYGGVSKSDQKRELRSARPVVVIATPGRLVDLLNEGPGTLDLSGVTHFVLDEADRMLDMGFEPDIARIVAQLPAKEARRTVMFSATWPRSIQTLAARYLVSPIRITIAKVNARSGALMTCSRVKQIVEVLPVMRKDARLQELLREYFDGKRRVLVFVL